MLVTLAIASLVIPAVLYTNFYLISSTKRGSNLNVAAAEARHIRQYLVKKINSSGKNIRISDDGNMIKLELYDETSMEWNDAVLAFNEDRKIIVYYTLDDTGNPIDTTTVARSIYRTNKRAPIFSPVGNRGVVRCSLYTGKQAPDNRTKTAGYFVHPGIFINLRTAPKNLGKNNEL